MAVIEDLEGLGTFFPISGISSSSASRSAFPSMPMTTFLCSSSRAVYSMKGSTAFSTCFSLSEGSKATGAGSVPFCSAIAAAWRASTWTIEPAAASTALST